MKDAQQKQDALTSHMAQLLREYANGTKQLSDNETQDLLQQGHHVRDIRFLSCKCIAEAAPRS